MGDRSNTASLGTRTSERDQSSACSTNWSCTATIITYQRKMTPDLRLYELVEACEMQGENLNMLWVRAWALYELDGRHPSPNDLYAHTPCKCEGPCPCTWGLYHGRMAEWLLKLESRVNLNVRNILISSWCRYSISFQDRIVHLDTFNISVP